MAFLNRILGMGTKVHCKSILPEFYSMRDLNQDSNGCSWPLYYGDKTVTNGQYYSGILPRAVTESYSGYDKDAVKQTMLQHEAIFKNQVYELHRLYRIQKDLMEEVKRKELHKIRIGVESSMSSSPLNSQITSEDARKWRMPGFPLASSVCARPLISAIEDIHSPLSSVKGSNMQVGALPFQNGVNSKDVELLDSRPAKVRRKMIDLQLPADEYIDTEDGEQFRDETVSATSSYLPNGSKKIAPESGVKLFAADSEKSGCQKNALRSDSYLGSTNNLADLNEPIPTEETNTAVYFDLHARTSRDGDIKGHELSAKPKSQLPVFPKEISMNSHHEGNNGTPNNGHLENNENGRRWLSPVLEAGPRKSDLKSISQGLQHKKSSISSQPVQSLFNKAHEPPTFLLTDQSKVWGERTIHGLEISKKNHEISHANHPESIVASNISTLYPITSASDLFNSWPHSASFWEKPSGSLSQKPMSVETHPFLNSSDALSQSSQISAQTFGIFGNGWHLNSNARPNSSFESELSKENGFYYGSLSDSKDSQVQVPSSGYNCLNYGNDNHIASQHVINHGSATVYSGSSTLDMKSAKDVNLNVVHSISFQEAVPQPNLEVRDGGRKHEDHLTVLPWLRAKPSCKNEVARTGRDLNVGELSFLQSSLNQSANKNEVGNNQIFTPNLNVVENSRVERNDFPSDRKILGFPFAEKPHISKNESPSRTSPSMSIPPRSDVEVKENRKNRILDMNLPCDTSVPDLSQQNAKVELIEMKSEVKAASFRDHIDLNSCVSEVEVSLMPTILTSYVKTAGIDLEAPIVPETEEDVICGEEFPQNAEQATLQSPQCRSEIAQDEHVRVAAEAIVAISLSAPENHLADTTSNSSEVSIKDPLKWFVEIVSSCGDDTESKLDAILRPKESGDTGDSSSEGFDYFESMTLKFTETKEEEYMPKPLVPENFKVEETGTSLLPNRARKGQGRRGRQRRDFQRDILPGLASLSRHEVTEDLQTFGGMMRATGHSWSGLTRRNLTRNGCARGRRRAVLSPSATPPPATTACTPLVQQFINVEVGLDDRSVTGWGKTTRRPRRQRCPTGNPSAILT